MDANVERECSALGGLFNQIIADMKNGTPLWEDLISRATKLHACLRAAILAVSAYLEAFQKIADAATNSRGATKEIGTALTRICLRHKAVETRMKSFTCAIMDRLVMPLQEKLEDWKKTLITLDKEHTKEYKRAKSELKKRSTDTLRLQKKKARKGIVQSHGHNQTSTLQVQSNRIDDSELNRLLESSAASVQEKRLSLEETERKAVRAALLEERGRFCQFAKFLRPVLDEEISMLMELTHLQEVSDQLERHAASPHDLPAASEQVITDLKGREMTQWALSTPPSSPSLSLGSRKSSMCSISSLNSSSSGSCKNHPSSCNHQWHRSMSQVSNVSSHSNQSNCPTKPMTNATWPDLQETAVLERDAQASSVNERPHTISSAYEKGHQRPALSVYTFQAPDAGCCHSQPASPVSSPSSNPQLARVQMRKNSAGNMRPPIPSRCSSLERPAVSGGKNDGAAVNRGKPKLPLPAHLMKDLGNHQQPMYVNMHELASLAANRAQEMQIPAPAATTSTSRKQTSSNNTSVKTEAVAPEKDVGSATSESSLESSSGYGSQSTLPTFPGVPSESEQTAAPPTAVPGGSCTIPRRGSMQQTRPPPPARRTSTIIASNYASTTMIGASGGLIAATVLTAGQRTETTVSDETENLPPPPAFLLEGNSPAASPPPQRSISVSETVRTLTELRHTPASPSFLRKASNQQQTQPQGAVNQITHSTFTERSSSSRRVSTTSMESTSSASSAQYQGPGGVGQGFMAVLSSKLINTSTSVNSSSSPKSTRKHINVEANQSPRTPVGFLETLNAKLAAQQQQQAQQSQMLPHSGQMQQTPQVIQISQGRSSTTSRSASVRRIMANRVPIIDPHQVRSSLMDQIRRGTSLRTSGPINDRSAPQIY
ncbi:MTSS1-like protein isoform X2 [Fopius arisanus]|uniref:MTSS1-like protein isoform X2 n=1 Tax=Fopius arisanus TaxID=64838 RepID=A0A9R1UA59_9HYME|nr:PREDICTED: MTSS1-like protein isoform X2 [Fopius arisanus]